MISSYDSRFTPAGVNLIHPLGGLSGPLLLGQQLLVASQSSSVVGPFRFGRSLQTPRPDYAGYIQSLVAQVLMLAP